MCVGVSECDGDGDASVHVRGEACVYVHYYVHVEIHVFDNNDQATLTINAGVESHFVSLIRQNYGRNSMFIKEFL